MTGGQIDDQWPWYRQLISRVATWVIRPLLPCVIHDPLSGYLAIKKTLAEESGQKWHPIGSKLGLEIIVKSRVKNIREVPIYFRERHAGKSKLMGSRMAWLYAKQVAQWMKEP